MTQIVAALSPEKNQADGNWKRLQAYSLRAEERTAKPAEFLAVTANPADFLAVTVKTVGGFGGPN